MLTQSDKNLILKMHEDISIYSPWTDSRLFKKIIDELSRPFMNLNVDKVVGTEARGFILGGAVAYKIGAGFVLVRKKDKMYAYDYPKDLVYLEECVDYSGTRKGLEIEKNGKAVKEGDKVIIIDDWYGSGAQGNATIRLVEKAGGKVAGVGIMLDEMDETVKRNFDSYNLHALMKRDPKE